MSDDNLASKAEKADNTIYGPPREETRQQRDAAVEWACSILADDSAVVVDTETTSIDGALVLEFAAVDQHGERLVDQLINPCHSISPKASAVHGLFDQDVAHAPTFNEVASSLASAMSGRTIIAWNASFDQRALSNSYTAWNLNTPTWVCIPWEDAMVWYAQYRGEWDYNHGRYRWHKLNGGHRAGGDCLEVWNRIRMMAGRVCGTSTISSIADPIDHLNDVI